MQTSRVSFLAITILAGLAILLFVGKPITPNDKKEKVVLMKTVSVGVFENNTFGLPTTHSATLNWTAPTTCTDGTTCTASGYNVYKASIACPATGLPTGATKIASAITTTTFTDTPLLPGTYCYYVTAIGGTGSNGAEGSASNLSQGVLAQPAISAPTNFTVTVN